ncbi:MAG: hypothetical protein HY324_00665, partial [Chlamydiia bacterium]|nr:hypothetical protein [Chlamydiia bacterium]
MATFLTFITFVAIVIAFLQSGFLHRLSIEKLSQFAQETGWDVKVEKSEGFLPFSFQWKDLILSRNGIQVEIDQVVGKIAFLSLFRSPLRLTQLQVGSAKIT